MTLPVRCLVVLLGGALHLSQAQAAPATRSGKAHQVAPHRPARPGPVQPAPPPAPLHTHPSTKAIGALQQGAASFLSGDYQAALKQLRPVGEVKAGETRLLSHDYALYFLAESEALLGEEAAALAQAPGDARRLLEAALQHFQALQKLSQSRFVSVAQARAADCMFALAQTGDATRDPAARAAYQGLLRAPGPELDPAALRFHLAEIMGRTGQGPQAGDEYRQVYVAFPWHPLAERALGALQRTGQAPRIEASEHLRRAQALSQSRRWPEAISELALISPDVGPALKDEVDYWIGSTYYKMRRSYDVAAQKLLHVATHFRGERQAEALFHGARALSRADKDTEAVARYQELVKTHPGSHFAAEASFLSGWLEYNQGRYREAIPRLADTARRYSGQFAEDARWYQALSHYLLHQDAAALQLFQQVAARQSGTAGDRADRGRYFAARTLQRMDHQAEAQQVYRALVADRPLTYYALLARARLRDSRIELGVFGEGKDQQPVIPLLQMDQRLAQDPQIARVDELLQVGLPVEAGFELRRAEGALLKKYGAQQALPLLFDRYLRGQNFQRPYLLGESYGARALKQDPHKSAAARLYWEHVYPLAYRAHVETYAPTGENPPRYLYTIMQKESAYNPHDVSYADAIGLLQMIPPTSRLVARHVGRPYTDDVLYDPEGNIAFGAWYIGHLLGKFKGQIALGAGSFNAGPRAMVKWLKQHGDLPLDEFIELCPYTQTREYMKKVLDIYAHYVYLWDRQEYLPELRIDKDYLQDDGIDY